jgi:hypothetical protein
VICGIKGVAAVAATRGDLGQLAPRKKLLKSWQSFLETLRALWHGGFFILPSLLPESILLRVFPSVAAVV